MDRNKRGSSVDSGICSSLFSDHERKWVATQPGEADVEFSRLLVRRQKSSTYHDMKSKLHIRSLIAGFVLGAILVFTIAASTTAPASWEYSVVTEESPVMPS